MKKSAICILLILAVFFGVSAPAYAYTLPAGTEINARAAVLMNVETGAVVYSKNPDQKMYPASTTKLMTALVTVENVSDYDAVVTAHDGVKDDFLGTDASVVNILPGEQMTVTDLLYALLVPSACDAADVLANYVSGSTSEFVDLMNEKARELGMTGTNYVNAHGLHEDEQYTTAHDLMLLAKEIIKYPLLTEICGSTYYVIPATNMSEKRTVYTTNSMMDANSRWYYRRIKGLKTGYTDLAGRCLVSLAEKDGQQYIGVVMGCTPKDANGNIWHYEFEDTDALMRWAYTSLSYLCTVEKGTPVSEVKVKLCKETDHILAIPQSDYYSIIPDDSKDSIIVEPHLDSSEITAPIEQGQKLGYATVYCAGEEIGQIDLVASDSCEKSGWLAFTNVLKTIFTSKIFIVIVVLIFILLLTFVILNVRYNQKRRKLFNSKIRRH